MRVLHVPTNTGGHPQGLARAERALGIASRAVALRQSYLDMDVDEVLWPAGMSLPQQMRAQMELIRRAIRDYDIIHYNSGQTIATVVTRPDLTSASWKRRAKFAAGNAYGYALQRFELALLRRSGKPFFVTYQGSDARQRDVCRRSFEISYHHEPESTFLPGGDDRVRAQIQLLTRHAERVYALNPDLLRMLPDGAEFLPYASVDAEVWQPVWRDAARPLIVHAPTRRWIKGTRYILEAVERLKADGLDFDFELIEGLSNKEARGRYEDAHLLVDQLLAGWYGGLAVEAMALGKPVVCYVREEDLHAIPDGMRADLPLIHATPSSLYEILKAQLARPLGEWRELGRRSRAYVERWHDPMRIAARVVADYRAAHDTRGRKIHESK